ncbi:PAS domain S-box protein [Tissierella sp. MSJ-40]|uniref:PAS domain S-box protein n=1 Tax=Tissierella simiarum TaxID=2841534 RepID=A0ABS6E1T1_9FIRM|nr:PAS domain-containing sensor histidine kinase [Tissierella simiarum]MBU5436859.1 PAS domain S-box protein [Tissierella simiarum]
MNKHSLEFKIPFFIMIFALSCVLITGALLQFIIVENVEANILSKNLIISRMISEQIDIYINNAKDTVVTAANFSSQSHGDMSQIEREIFRIYDNFDYFDLIFYMNDEAQMKFAKPSNSHVRDRIYTDRDYYWESIHNNRVHISPLLISSVLGKPHFIISAPVYDINKQNTGLIGAGLPLDNIKKVVEKTQKHFSGNIWVTDDQGVIGVHPEIDSDSELIKIDSLGIQLLNVNHDVSRILEEKEEAIIRYTREDQTYYGAITFVPIVNWMIVVEQDERSIFYELVQLKKRLKIVILAVLSIALFLGLILAKKITNPIKKLVQQVRGWGRNIKAPKIETEEMTDCDEISELRDAFEDMTVRLDKNLHELEESYLREYELKQYLNNILKSVANGILVIDKKGKITVFNKQAEAISQYKAVDFINKNINEFLSIINLDLGDIIVNTMENNMVITDMEEVLINQLGEEVSISISSSPVLDNNKNIIGMVFLFRDLSRIKEIEKELKREDRIRTLGELSASIIHDIGNPLAGMGNLIEILKDKSYDMDVKAEVLDVLHKEIDDLNNLVINFLDFSRDAKFKKEQSNILDILNNAIKLLKYEMINKKIKLKIKKLKPDDSLVTYIDRRAIKQILINIIKNSIQAVDVGGTIDITIDKDSDYIWILVEDNGAGISKSQLENIFYPFYTTKEDGTGLGLSTAYKLIKEHKGQIDVKSNLGEGTEFKIILPLNDANN